MNLHSHKNLSFFIITTLVSILGGYLIFRATTWGTWAFSDSAAYLSAARNIQAGYGATIQNSNGSFTPVTEFPPFFPFLLSHLSPKNGDFLSTERWINITLFALSIFIVGLLVYKATDSLLPGIFSSVLLAVSPLMVDTFSGFMSEPLFIASLLLLIYLFFEFINSKKSVLLIPILLISSLLPLIRYAGILFVFCLGICFFLYRKNYLKRISRFIPAYIIVSLIPIGLWFLDQYNKLNKVGGKRFLLDITFAKGVFHSILQEFNIIKGWIPYSGIYASEIINWAIFILFVCVFSILLIAGFWASINKAKTNNRRTVMLFQICIIFFSAYILFIGFTQNLTIPSIDIIDRMMAPIYPFIVMILLCAFVLLTKERKGWIMRSIVILIALVSIRFYSITTLKAVEELHVEGKGFSSRQYQQSEFLSKLVSLPQDRLMISNSAAFVLFHTNRFPLQVDQFHNRLYGSGNHYGEKTFHERNAALIILFPEFRNYYGEKSDQLLQSLTTGLKVDFSDEIGGIYYFPE